MSGGHHGDRFPDRIHPALQAIFVNVGKTLGKIAFHVGGIQSHEGGTRAFHLPVNGPGDHVAGSQIRERMVFFKKGFSLGVDQFHALPANRLGDQKTVTVRRMQGGWMKLHEFQVHRGEPGPGGHGHPVTRGDGWVGGVEVGLPRSTGCQQNHGRGHRDDAVPVGIEEVNAQHPVVIALDLDSKLTGFPGGDQINGKVMLEEGDSLLGDVGKQGILDRLAGDVLDVEHAPFAVPTLLAEGNASVIEAGKGNPHFGKVLNPGGSVP